MKQYSRIAGLIMCCIVCLSCGKTDKAAVFSQKLQSIDLLIQTGDTKKAVKKLQSLRRKAELSIQYLSIAKRELSLQLPVSALQTLQAGLKKHPDNPQLNAVMVHTLLEEQRPADAVLYADKLNGTAYAGVGTEAFISMDKIGGAYNTPVDFWKEGFLLAGEQVFLQNAAAVSAAKGDIAQAAAMRSSIPKKESVEAPYFWACLAYDLGDFKPVIDDLFYSLAYADMAGLPEHNPQAFEYARRHLLLAADASAGLQQTEEARGFWQSYIDRYPEDADSVFYNLAMTAGSEEAKITALVECLTANPVYYPAAAQYIRTLSHWNNQTRKRNQITKLLENKDFFSLEMERILFHSAAFTLSAEDVLNNALQAAPSDHRFILEQFRTDYLVAKRYDRATAAMWNLLEQYADIPVIRAYGRWFFAYSGDLNAAFGIEKNSDEWETAFYEGLEYAVKGASSKSLTKFAYSQQDERYTVPAWINQAYLYAAREEFAEAIQFFVKAARSLGENTALKSKLLYEAARIYALRKGSLEALELLKEVLMYDPGNERAALLQRQLQTQQF